MKRVVIVAGHAVLRRFDDPRDERNWFLLPFQTGEVPYLIGHVEAGVRAAATDPEALLVFSGGQTRLEASQRSEAESYAYVAEALGWFGCDGVAGRVALEEYARDSFENLLFSLARFQQRTGAWPEHATFVSWSFKAERFELHREAMGWPAERFAFLGANNPPELAQALAAEERTRAGYAVDPYSQGTEFAAKKASRNPFGRQPPYGLPEAGPWPWVK